MARQIERMQPPRSVKRRRYPWDEWTNGKPWEITQGEDFDVAADDMRTMIYNRARRSGRIVTVTRSGSNPPQLQFQFLPGMP